MDTIPGFRSSLMRSNWAFVKPDSWSVSNNFKNCLNLVAIVGTIVIPSASS